MTVKKVAPKAGASKQKQGIVLFVGPVPNAAIAEWKQEGNPEFLLYNLQSKRQKKAEVEKAERIFDKVVQCSFNDRDSIVTAIKPFRNDIVAMTARGDTKQWYFKRTIPHVPYINTPTEASILWATDKIQMRKRMRAYNPDIVPKFVIVHNDDHETIEQIEKKIDYPVMVKPSGLASSLLVTNCYHRSELESALWRVFKKANIFHRLYKEFYGDDTPQVLVEELMEGEMYSIDGVIDGKGKVYAYPSVHVKTGKQMGFDDYFGYLQKTPTVLKQNNYDKLVEVATEGLHAIGLRYSSFHAELIRTEEGWKIVEIAPRIGGFRQTLYQLSYGIDCTMNDILVRIGKAPKVPKVLRGHTAAMKVFAQKEGVIKSIKGVKKIEEIASIHKITQNKTIGDRLKFAKNGGKSIFNIILHSKERAELLADIRRTEQILQVIV